MALTIALTHLYTINLIKMHLIDIINTNNNTPEFNFLFYSLIGCVCLLSIAGVYIILKNRQEIKSWTKPN